MTGDEPHTGCCLVATPPAADAVNAISQEEQAHVTLLWLGDRAELDEEHEHLIRQHVQLVTSSRGEFTARVNGRAVLGDDDAGVLLLESHALVELRNDLFDHPAVRRVWLSTDQFPTWIPHLTLTYGGGLPKGELPKEVVLSDVGYWLGGVHESHPLARSAMPIDDPNFRTDYDAAMGSIIPPVYEAADLPVCVQFAVDHPDARWYAEKVAASMGMTDLIPANWGAVPA